MASHLGRWARPPLHPDSGLLQVLGRSRRLCLSDDSQAGAARGAPRSSARAPPRSLAPFLPSSLHPEGPSNGDQSSRSRGNSQGGLPGPPAHHLILGPRTGAPEPPASPVPGAPPLRPRALRDPGPLAAAFLLDLPCSQPTPHTPSWVAAAFQTLSLISGYSHLLPS